MWKQTVAEVAEKCLPPVSCLSEMFSPLLLSFKYNMLYNIHEFSSERLSI